MLLQWQSYENILRALISADSLQTRGRKRQHKAASTEGTYHIPTPSFPNTRLQAPRARIIFPRPLFPTQGCKHRGPVSYSHALFSQHKAASTEVPYHIPTPSFPSTRLQAPRARIIFPRHLFPTQGCKHRGPVSYSHALFSQHKAASTEGPYHIPTPSFHSTRLQALRSRIIFPRPLFQHKAASTEGPYHIPTTSFPSTRLTRLQAPRARIISPRPLFTAQGCKHRGPVSYSHALSSQHKAASTEGPYHIPTPSLPSTRLQAPRARIIFPRPLFPAQGCKHRGPVSYSHALFSQHKAASTEGPYHIPTTSFSSTRLQAPRARIIFPRPLFPAQGCKHRGPVSYSHALFSQHKAASTEGPYHIPRPLFPTQGCKHRGTVSYSHDLFSPTQGCKHRGSVSYSHDLFSQHKAASTEGPYHIPTHSFPNTRLQAPRARIIFPRPLFPAQGSKHRGTVSYSHALISQHKAASTEAPYHIPTPSFPSTRLKAPSTRLQAPRGRIIFPRPLFPTQGCKHRGTVSYSHGLFSQHKAASTEGPYHIPTHSFPNTRLQAPRARIIFPRTLFPAQGCKHRGTVSYSHALISQHKAASTEAPYHIPTPSFPSTRLQPPRSRIIFPRPLFPAQGCKHRGPVSYSHDLFSQHKAASTEGPYHIPTTSFPSTRLQAPRDRIIFPRPLFPAQDCKNRGPVSYSHDLFSQHKTASTEGPYHILTHSFPNTRLQAPRARIIFPRPLFPAQGCKHRGTVSYSHALFSQHKAASTEAPYHIPTPSFSSTRLQAPRARIIFPRPFSQHKAASTEGPYHIPAPSFPSTRLQAPRARIIFPHLFFPAQGCKHRGRVSYSHAIFSQHKAASTEGPYHIPTPSFPSTRLQAPRARIIFPRPLFPAQGYKHRWPVSYSHALFSQHKAASTEGPYNIPTPSFPNTRLQTDNIAILPVVSEYFKGPMSYSLSLLMKHKG
ncbi:unnamed protein product [Acanthosepion pharaonis]|uniref:Uncharacterized protein n=1 Tax=Acanthosepion pharaonis TaxID=158019 RepID=A0A812CW97_ACAPH|nr:unnamed protein product [Sepia pharaonis]